MHIFASRSAIVLAALAATTMTVSPVMARERGGWGGHHRRHHDGFDGGDFLLGALLVGGIVAVASVANSSSREEPEASYRDDADTAPVADRTGYHDQPGLEDDPASGSQRGVAYRDARSALEACSAEASRSERGVEGVDSVSRESDGYRVDGRLRDGHDFTCSVDREGRLQHFALDVPGALILSLASRSAEPRLLHRSMTSEGAEPVGS